MIIPIKTVEEMTETERRQYLETLIEDYVLVDQDGNGVSPEEFLNEVPVDELLKHRTRRPKAQDLALKLPTSAARVLIGD